MWYNILVILVLLAISNLSVTVYLHRVLTHKSIKLHKALEHFFRIVLWMTTPFPPKVWAAMHRYHHHTADTPKDPHSPMQLGVKHILTKGASYSIKKHAGPEMDRVVEIYSKDIQDSKLEQFYLSHPRLGKILLLIGLVPVCGFWAPLVWIISVLWMVVMEERVHVVMSHYWGYRNYETNDNSKNIIPWAIVLFGEELHNNHHAKQSDWSFRKKWYEIDPAAIFIQICIWLRLAYPNTIKK